MKISLNLFNGPFNLSYTLESEQCPADLWRFKDKPETYLEIDGNWIKFKISQLKDYLKIEPSRELNAIEEEKLESKILNLFWADYPLEKFYEEFSSDPYLNKIIKALEGTRVMKAQDISWSLVEAIYSQNTTTEQVRNRDRLFRRNYGEKIEFENGEIFYTFPKLSKIVELTEEELRENCKVGYRAEYILNAAGTFDEKRLMKLKDLSSKEAREKLMEVKGIGPKVADIFLLYGFGRSDVFPMDVWLKRALRREYFDNKKVSERKLREFALDYFGQHAGFAHLYMFYWERKKKK